MEGGGRMPARQKGRPAMKGGKLKALTASERGGLPGFWIDHLEYSRRLFLGEGDSFADIGRLASVYAQAQRLLDSDVIDLRIESYAASWLARRGGAFADAGRPVQHLRQMLGDESFRGGLAALLGALEALLQGTNVLALTLPSPKRWLALLGDAGSEEDQIELAAMEVADFLRAFSQAGLHALLIEEHEAGGAFGLYRPLVELTERQEWGLALQVAGDVDPVAMTLGTGGEIDLCFVTEAELAKFAAAEDVPAAGLILPRRLWTEGLHDWTRPPGCEFYHARIPAGANPEAVRAALKTLRA